jgi:hypothetical protein
VVDETGAPVGGACLDLTGPAAYAAGDAAAEDADLAPEMVAILVEANTLAMVTMVLAADGTAATATPTPTAPLPTVTPTG